MGFAVISFIYSKRSEEKVRLSAEKTKFERMLHADDFITLRVELYKIYCSKNGDPQALKGTKYKEIVDRIGQRYLDIRSLLEKHPEFKEEDENIFNLTDWKAMIKCYKVFPEDYRKMDEAQELLEYAKDHLKNESIDDIDPCE